MPIDLAEAAAASSSRVATESVDVARSTGACFVNNSSIGRVPGDGRHPRRHPRPAGAGGRSGRCRWRRGGCCAGSPPGAWTSAVDGQRWHRRTPFVFVGNNNYEVGPRGIGDRTEVARGVLCCYVAQTETRLGSCASPSAPCCGGRRARPSSSRRARRRSPSTPTATGSWWPSTARSTPCGRPCGTGPGPGPAGPGAGPRRAPDRPARRPRRRARRRRSRRDRLTLARALDGLRRMSAWSRPRKIRHGRRAFGRTPPDVAWSRSRRVRRG